jgi:DNA-binding CsgD family transcriptional regulator
MLTTVTCKARGFDNDEFRQALKAADFERCRTLADACDSPEALLSRARLALREHRAIDVIGMLSDFPLANAGMAQERDVFLGAALGSTREFIAGRRLLDRALSTLRPGDPLYDEALYYKSAIAWMQLEHSEADELASLQLASADPNNRARARIVLSWIALRRGEILRQVEELQKALDEIDAAQTPDQYLRANALYNLAILCRELPLEDVSERVRQICESLPWASGLKLEHFQVTRFLAGIDQLAGNELAAFAGFRKAARLAPSEHWTVLCFLDRALLARNTGEMAFATEQLLEAHEMAQRLSWSDVTGEERSALLMFAELFAHDDPAMAEQYLARFRAIRSSVIPLLSYGTDPRVRGFETYTQGVAWLRIGDISEAQAALTEAWSIFEDFNYAWRGALCALALYEATHDRRWLRRAARKIDPWPNSWIARRVEQAENNVVLDLARIPRAKRDVLELVRAGRRNSDIAKQLGRSPNTVRNQLSQLFATFNVKSRAELVALLSRQVVPLSAFAQRHRRPSSF